jgi:hypothetical protein
MMSTIYCSRDKTWLCHFIGCLARGKVFDSIEQQTLIAGAEVL